MQHPSLASLYAQADYVWYGDCCNYPAIHYGQLLEMHGAANFQSECTYLMPHDYHCTAWEDFGRIVELAYAKSMVDMALSYLLTYLHVKGLDTSISTWREPDQPGRSRMGCGIGALYSASVWLLTVLSGETYLWGCRNSLESQSSYAWPPITSQSVTKNRVKRGNGRTQSLELTLWLWT
jgi:hypothetical protein